MHAYKKLPGAIQSRVVENWLNGEVDGKKARLAILGFEIFGPDAAPAVPGLVGLLRDSRSVGRRQNVMCCLRWVGPGARSALPYLAGMVADAQSGLSADAALTMEIIEPGSGMRFVTNAADNRFDK